MTVLTGPRPYLALGCVGRDAEEEFLILGVLCVLGQLLQDVLVRGACDVQVVAQGRPVTARAREGVLLTGFLCTQTH